MLTLHNTTAIETYARSPHYKKRQLEIYRINGRGHDFHQDLPRFGHWHRYCAAKVFLIWIFKEKLKS
jgi:hypothetical protein